MEFRKTSLFTVRQTRSVLASQRRRTVIFFFKKSFSKSRPYGTRAGGRKKEKGWCFFRGHALNRSYDTVPSCPSRELGASIAGRVNRRNTVSGKYPAKSAAVAIVVNEDKSLCGTSNIKGNNNVLGWFPRRYKHVYTRE